MRNGLKHMGISLLVMLALALAVKWFHIPNPNMILVTGLAVFTALYGYPAGIVCGIVMLAYSMYFFSEDHSFLFYTSENLAKMGAIFLAAVCNILFIGHLEKVNTDAHNQLRELNAMLQYDNALLQQASAVDELTGCRNRFAFRRDYPNYENRFLHVMMFDLDDFKTTNDTYGHAAGDTVLRKTGACLRSAFGDRACYRYGGDEFLIICPDTENEAFSGRAEEVRRKLAALEVDGQPLPTRFSGGHVYGEAKQPGDMRLMLRQADHNLYRVKAMGKHRFFGTEYSRAFAEELDRTTPNHKADLVE